MMDYVLSPFSGEPKQTSGSFYNWKLRYSSQMACAMRFPLLFVLTVIICSGADFYVAQTAQASADGSSCGKAYAMTFVNTRGNWANPKAAGKVGPGDVVHLCGLLTTAPWIYQSGNPGIPITFLWEPGARISFVSGQMIWLNGSKGYLVFDGGAPCGPGTACDAAEAANITGYASGQTGIIEATANGSGLANQSITTQAFMGCDGCHDIEIRNLIIRNLYQHTSLADSKMSADTGNFAFQCPGGNSGCAAGTISIHDSTVHDTGNAISIQKTSNTTVNVYNVDFYRNNWAMEISGSGTRALNIYGNHVHDATNWDTTANTYHHNFLHFYMDAGPTDSLASNVYNNLSAGDWGSCCTTATMIYSETTNPANFNVFNNVALQATGNRAPAYVMGATGGVFANNTIIGSMTQGSSYAVSLYGSWRAVENNVVSGYTQLITEYTHTSFSATTFDYNQWGSALGTYPWDWISHHSPTFADWKSACGCDAHSPPPADSLGLNTGGTVQPGSPVIAAGANLASLGIPALNFDNVGVPRASIGAWDIGAFVYNALRPPTSLQTVLIR